jgi:2-polyprenyl-3-methyl-5-hydroxy-6-metoxy-1,4-benzoquinol methylase
MYSGEKYVIKDNVVILNEADNFSYSDGDENERTLCELMQKISDRSVGSEEFSKFTNSWVNLYHLSPKRVDLLRPFEAHLKGKRLLEIGSGCGAITRYLGELGCEVVALEGSFNRAKITAARCRDLKNVQVVCSNFESFVSEEKYDFVLLIGVLEYCNLYINSENPSQAILSMVRNLLTIEGALIIAIENKLGLKYWAGAPEDHIGVPYFGIENKYQENTVITFGKEELEDNLKEAGFYSNKFLFPFPDYKFSEVIITERGTREKKLNLADLIFEKIDYFQGDYYVSNFSTTLAAENIAKNSLLEGLSNSFLVISSLNDNNLIDENVLAFSYSTNRKKYYAKENIFKQKENGIEVERKYLYKVERPQLSVIENQICNEEYINGNLLVRSLLDGVSRIGWNIASVSAWVRKYYSVLLKFSFSKEEAPFLAGKYLDLTPFNIIIDADNNARVFDLEWIAHFDLPLKFVFFRGLVYTLGRIIFYAEPLNEVPRRIIDLAVKMINEVVPFNQEDINNCKQIEFHLFKDISFQEFNVFGFHNINIRTNSSFENLQDLGRYNSYLLNEIANKNFEVYQLNQELSAIKFNLSQTEQELYRINTHVFEQLNDYKEFNLEIRQSIKKIYQDNAAKENKVLLRISENTNDLVLLKERTLESYSQLEMIVQSLSAFKELFDNHSKEKEGIVSLLNTYEKRIASLEQYLKTRQEENEQVVGSMSKIIENQKKDLEWYKKTYEERTLAGLIKDRLFKS